VLLGRGLAIVAVCVPIAFAAPDRSGSPGSCPVTHANHVVPPAPGQGWPTLFFQNRYLRVHVSSDGGLLAFRQRDGTFFQKLGWSPRRGLRGRLVVSGRRLDASSPPMRVLGVHWGYAYSGFSRRGGWASAVTFPSGEGCWRITGRVRRVTLSYVVRVVGV
jgi:hypothetical protein